MIKIAIHRDEMMAQFIISGHAGYAERGQDIVCAGVSTVTGILEGLAEAWRDAMPTMRNLVAVDDDDSGPSHVMIDTNGNAAVDAAIDCIIDAYRQLAEQYPDNVTIKWIE